MGEIAEFELWRIASGEHERVYRELEALWNGLVPSVATDRRASKRAVLNSSARRYDRWAVRFAQMAAAIFAVLIISQYLTTWRYDYHTGPGEIRELTLADGSRLYMKGNTALNADVSKSGPRKIELARGEAFFVVEHKADQPFTVDVGSGTVRDIGTAFSVSRKGKAVSVAVAEGIVAVFAAGESDTLYEGQQVGFNMYKMSAKSLVDTAYISAWRRGVYIADGKALGVVLSDLSEYHAGQIVISDEALAGRRVNAVVQLDHVDDWLEALGNTEGVEVRRYGPLVFVSAR